jgi:hypothetical protein
MRTPPAARPPSPSSRQDGRPGRVCGLVVVRTDPAYYSAAFASGPPGRHSVLRHGDLTPKIAAAIAAISEEAWNAIRHPARSGVAQPQSWVAGAGIARGEYTADASKKDKDGHRTAGRRPGPAT